MSTEHHILVVDDSATLGGTLANDLRARRFRATYVQSGAEALATIRRDPPVVVVLDVVMPGLNGFQVCREIKRSYPHIHVILLTSKATSADHHWGKASGADVYLTKPVELSALLGAISKLLNTE